MEDFVNIVLSSGRSAIELVLYILMPVMVFMMAIMKIVESKGGLYFLAKFLTPLLGIFGIPGIGALAILQILFVSFIAPVATRNNSKPLPYYNI